MMRFKQGRARRRGDLRANPGATIEGLEPRQLMTLPPGAVNYYSFNFIQPRTVNPSTGNNFISHPIGESDRVLSRLDNDGRLITGKDRQGDEYTLILHG